MATGYTFFNSTVGKLKPSLGRVTLAEYFCAQVNLAILSSVLMFVLSLICGIAGLDTAGTIITGAIGLFYVISTISLMIRRLHDTGRSGWWILLCLTGILAIVPAIFCLGDTVGSNQYGEGPKPDASPEPSFDNLKAGFCNLIPAITGRLCMREFSMAMSIMSMIANVVVAVVYIIAMVPFLGVIIGDVSNNPDLFFSVIPTAMAGVGGITLIISIVLLILMCLIAVRRLHDSGRAGSNLLWLLLPLIGILVVFAKCLADTDEENEYGEVPEDAF